MPLLDKVKGLFGRRAQTKTLAPVNDIKLGAIIGLVIAAISIAGILEKYELVLLDEMFRIRGEQKVNDDLAIVEIEDQSLEVIGRWPWPRAHHADLLNILGLAKPKAVVFDVLFTESDAQGDAPLAAAADILGNVYLAAYFSLENRPSILPSDSAAFKKIPRLQYTVKKSDTFPHAASVTLPVDVLANAAKRVVITNVPQDNDGPTRRLPLVIEFNGVLYPALGLQLACDYLGVDVKDIKVRPQAVILPLNKRVIRIPTDGSGRMILDYGGPITTFQRYSYLQVIRDYAESMGGGESKIVKRLGGKVLFVGHTATGTIDARIMPFSNTYPAVGIHATALSNILNGAFIKRAPAALNVFTVVFLGILTGALLKRGRKAAANLGIAASVFIIYAVLSFISFAFLISWINVFAPLLAITATYFGATINQYSAIRQEKKILENELLIARTIQQSFFPKSYPAVPSLEFAAKCSPAKHIGGDLYDFVALGDDKVGVLIGDVSGKGVPAALYMARTISEFRSTAHQKADPASTLKALNDEVSKEGMEKSFVTMQYVVIDLKSRKAIFSSGGHNAILHFSAGSRRIDEVDTSGGMPIGVMEGVDFDNKEMPMERGDLLILYTDGISESMNTRRKEFGIQRVKDIAAANCGLRAEEILLKVLEEVAKFSKGAPQHDDMTIIVIKAV